MEMISRLEKEDSVNNVEQITLSKGILATLVGSSSSTVDITISIRRTILQSSSQPFSLVLTGAFEFDAVDVKYNTLLNYKDNPQSERPWELPSWVVLAGLVLLILLIIGYQFI